VEETNQNTQKHITGNRLIRINYGSQDHKGQDLFVHRIIQYRQGKYSRHII